MEIYYININNFKNKHNIDILNSYADIELKTEKRFYEYTIGRYLVKKVATEFYNIIDTEIITTIKGKPIFKNANLHFSISHSNEIIIACFDNSNCGIDIEYMKKRNFSKLSNYFNQQFSTKEDFYKFWTLKEAAYKLGSTANSFCSYKFRSDYYISIASSSFKNINNIEPIELL